MIYPEIIKNQLLDMAFVPSVLTGNLNPSKRIGVSENLKVL